MSTAAGCDGPEKGGKRQYVDSGVPNAATCANTMCHRDATCRDTDEGPQCACKPGFTGTGLACSDVNECDNDTHDCDDNATCQNTSGGFTCTCNAPAWQGNGTSCSDANECITGDNDCSANAICINTVGSFTCECMLQADGGDDDAGSEDGGMSTPGMDGGIDNAMCRDIDECAMNVDDCDDNATCINSNDGYRCQCNAGYEETGDSGGHGEDGCTFAYCDLTGRWAVKSSLVVSWDNVLFNGGAVAVCGATRASTFAWELRDFEYDGETLRVRAKGCGSSVSPGHNLAGQKFGQYIPYATFDAIDLRTQQAREVALPHDTLHPGAGSAFVPPFETITFGLRLPNPDDENAWVTSSLLPPSRMCSNNEPPCWIDDDHDAVGAPGYTTWSLSPRSEPMGFYTLPNARVFAPSPQVGVLGACYTLGSRTISRFNGAFDQSCDRITGSIEVKQRNGQPVLDAWIQGCKIVTQQNDPFDCYDPVAWNAMESCTSANVATLNNQHIQRSIDDSSFEMVRVPDDTECPDVRAMFPVPTVTRDYCECGDPCVNHVDGCPPVDPCRCPNPPAECN